MVDPNMITNLLGNTKLSTTEITDMISKKSPIPVPAGIVQGILDQLVANGTIKKTEENGEVYYHV